MPEREDLEHYRSRCRRDYLLRRSNLESYSRSFRLGLWAASPDTGRSHGSYECSGWRPVVVPTRRYCDQSTHNSVGASVMIRTVYDKVNNDAHSYWVGSTLSNGAFVQVGYYNGLTTTNQYYCCAWFYEYFPAGNTNSPPIIGPAGSAGPIGSWHTYTMNFTGSGVWSFYMDNQFLGSSPAQGQQYYLGPGDTDSGTHPAAVLAEVAQTTSNTDVIGPAEFKNFMYETNTSPWQQVPVGKVHIWYGATSSMNLANPYSVAEVSGKQNDFLTGSDIPYPGPDECGSAAYYSRSNPSNLWSTTNLCIGNNATIPSLSFVDMNGTSLTPT